MNRTLKTAVALKLKNERGYTILLVALLLAVFLGLGALTIDLSHLYVVRNELQNAADAGALAGARFLYNSDGSAVNAGANQIAYDSATENKAMAQTAGTIPVEVNLGGGQDADVQRGHWSFATHTFTPNDSLVAVDLWDVSTADLDADPNFINAVKVITRRQSFPAASFFAKIFGYQSFQMSAEAIGYIGFAGTLGPGDVDQPIAICRESILQQDAAGEDFFSCGIGRMINSGQSVTSSETGGWTSFSQNSPCAGGTNANEVTGLVCGGGNPTEIHLGEPIATNGGEIQSSFNALINCWEQNTGRTQPWNLTLPVVFCPGNNVGTCEEVRGAVNLNIVWITGAGNDPSYDNAPTQMGAWSNNDPDGSVRWADFVQEFNLKNVDGSPAPYQKKAIYFLPDCTPHDLKGRTGGDNFGVLARIPVLVK